MTRKRKYEPDLQSQVKGAPAAILYLLLPILCANKDIVIKYVTSVAWLGASRPEEGDETDFFASTLKSA